MSPTRTEQVFGFRKMLGGVTLRRVVVWRLAIFEDLLTHEDDRAAEVTADRLVNGLEGV